MRTNLLAHSVAFPCSVRQWAQGVEKGSAVGEKMSCDRGCSLQKI